MWVAPSVHAGADRRSLKRPGPPQLNAVPCSTQTPRGIGTTPVAGRQSPSDITNTRDVLHNSAQQTGRGRNCFDRWECAHGLLTYRAHPVASVAARDRSVHPGTAHAGATDSDYDPDGDRLRPGTNFDHETSHICNRPTLWSRCGSVGLAAVLTAETSVLNS